MTCLMRTKTEISKIANFLGKMHIFVNMATQVDKCLLVFEENVCNGKNPYAFERIESGGPV